MSETNPIFHAGTITPLDIVNAVRLTAETPFYLYDAQWIIERCDAINHMMDTHFGFFPRYAMKANSSKALLELIAQQGFGMDASSLNEVRRAVMAGIPLQDILLTTQEVPTGKNRIDLEGFLRRGLRYNACSERQLDCIADFAVQNDLPISIRIHPGEGGAGESLTRDTANPYASFGIHISILETVLRNAMKKGLRIEQVHQHIGSGGSPERWKSGIDRFFDILTTYLPLLPDIKRINLGGGIKEGRMPGETPVNLSELGKYASQKVLAFYHQTGRKLTVEVEPGTYLVGMAGVLVTSVIDKKSTGPEGHQFIVADGGMELNPRPLMYGSKHPFAIISSTGRLLSSERDLSNIPPYSMWIPVGKCCETGDSQSLDMAGNVVPRLMSEPEVGDTFVVGGCGAYCASMSPANYNSHTYVAEVLKMPDGGMQLVRRRQTMEELTSGETPLRGFIQDS